MEDIKIGDSKLELTDKQRALAALENDHNWSGAQWRAIAVAGSGFLTDSYDNFIVSLLVPMVMTYLPH